MIKIVVQDMHRESARCPDLCANYKETGCGACFNRFRTAFNCPHCDAVRCYYGKSAPITCGSCRRLLPDFEKAAEQVRERVSYHKGKGLI